MAPTRTRPVPAPSIRTPRPTTTVTAGATRTGMPAATRTTTRTATTRTATTTVIPATTTTRLTATGTTLIPFSSSIVTAFSIDSVDGTVASTDIVGSTEVVDLRDIAEALSVMAGLAILGGSAVSGDVERAPSSLAHDAQGVPPSRAAASALAPRDLADARSVIADSDLPAPRAAVIRVFQVVLTAAAVRAAAREWPRDRLEDAEGASRLRNLDRPGEKRWTPAVARRRRSAVGRRGLPGRDLVLEVVRIETVQAAFGGFRLRIHEEGNRRAARSGQSDVVAEVVGHPVHFPEPEEPRAGLLHHLVVQRAIAGRLLEYDLSNIRGID